MLDGGLWIHPGSLAQSLKRKETSRLACLGSLLCKRHGTPTSQQPIQQSSRELRMANKMTRGSKPEIWLLLCASILHLTRNKNDVRLPFGNLTVFAWTSQKPKHTKKHKVAIWQPYRFCLKPPNDQHNESWKPCRLTEIPYFCILQKEAKTTIVGSMSNGNLTEKRKLEQNRKTQHNQEAAL